MADRIKQFYTGGAGAPVPMANNLTKEIPVSELRKHPKFSELFPVREQKPEEWRKLVSEVQRTVPPEPVDMPKDDELYMKVRKHPGFKAAWENRHQDVDTLQDIVSSVKREHEAKKSAEASENPRDPSIL